MRQTDQQTVVLAYPVQPLLTRALRLAKRQPTMVVSVVIILIASLAAILAPSFGLDDPNEIKMSEIRQPPSGDHILGTDQLGRDQLSRVLYGGRVSLLVGVFGVLLGVLAGAAWGIASGYAAGLVDGISQRFVEILLSIPGLLMAFMLAAMLKPGLMPVILAIAVTNVGGTCRVLRAVTLGAKEADYVMASRSIGASPIRTAVVHVAPNCIPPLMIMFSAQLGGGIILEATLGFLGIGVPPPAPSWGSMISTALANSFTPPWWLVIVPGLVISLVVLAFNFLGDALRDELDPRLRGSQ